MLPSNRGRRGGDSGSQPQSSSARVPWRFVGSALAIVATVALIVVAALLARQQGSRSREIVSRGLVPAAAPMVTGGAASPPVPPGARVLAQGASYVVVEVPQPAHPSSPATPTAATIVRIDIAGQFVPGDDLAQIYLDGNPVGVGQESADLATLSAVVADRGALREGALVSYGYRSRPHSRVDLPDRLHLQATP